MIGNERGNDGSPVRYRYAELSPLFNFVSSHNAVLDVDNPVRVFGDVVLVRHQHDRVSLSVQAIK